MSRVKTSLDHKRIRRLTWLVLTVFVLFCSVLQGVAGSAYYSLMMQAFGTVSSPPVILEEGTAGTSTIYANGTCAKASVEPPLFDYVDNNDPDVDSSADKGTHSNFESEKAVDGMDTLTEADQGSAGTPESWTSPTSFSDPSSHWTSETNAYDENTGTQGDCAYGSGSGAWKGYLELYLDSSVASSKCRWWITTGPKFDNWEVSVRDDPGWTVVLTTSSPTTGAWVNTTYTTKSVDAIRVRFRYSSGAGSGTNRLSEIDVLEDSVAGESDYELDLEIQWTNANYTRTNEELCIKTGTFSGSENIQVRVWNNTGSSWHWVMNLTASQWNNVSITPYLTSSTLTVQFLGGTETGDTTQDSWNIDATLLHIWTDESTWLSGWDKRVKITIGHNDIDSDLSDFPVLVYLSNSSGRNNDDATFVFDEVGSNSKKIAVTESDGTTQCFVEIEKWDNASERAWLWVKVPSISSTANTDLYLYYDSSKSDNTAYVGDKESIPAQKVWNTNFKGVWHLDEDPSGAAPQMKDSTSNNNNGTSYGNMTSSDQVTGQIDGSLDFNGTDENARVSDDPTLDTYLNNSFTLVFWFNIHSQVGVTWDGLVEKEDNTTLWSYGIYLNTAGTAVRGAVGHHDNGASVTYTASDMYISYNTWYQVAMVYNGTNLITCLNGTDTGRVAYNQGVYDGSGNLTIGSASWAGNTEYFNGTIDEVRISDIARSTPWIKASYESERDDLLDFGASGTSEGTYDYVLRVNNTETDSWQIRLKKYSDSNTNRLQNCTIYFYNSSDGTSRQIYIQNGAYINQTGPWYDLGDSETIYIAMTAEATSTGTSYVRTYLEILIPNTSTYARYIITFEIT